MLKKLLLFYVVSFLLGITASPATAGDFTWSGGSIFGSSTSWDVASNWNGGFSFVFPNSFDDSITINNFGGPSPELVASRNVGSIDVLGGSQLFLNSSQLTVNDSGTQNGVTFVNGGISASSTLHVEQGILETDRLRVTQGAAMMIGGGTVRIGTGGADFGFFGNQVLSGFGTVETAGFLANDGSIFAATGGGTLRIESTGNGYFDWDGDDFSLQGNSKLIVEPASTMDISAPYNDVYLGTIEVGLFGDFVVDRSYRVGSGGTINLDGGNLQASDTINLVSGGTINAMSGSSLITAPLQIDSGAELDISGSNTVEIAGILSLFGGDIVDTGSSIFLPTQGIRVNGDSTIDVSTFLWDRSFLTEIEENSSLTINANSVDLSDNQFDAIVNVNNGATLEVNTPTAWKNSGLMNLSGGRVKGSKITHGSNDVGQLKVLSGTNHIDAELEFGFMGDLFVDSGAALNLNGNTTFGIGSDITFIGTVVNNARLTLESPFFLDGSGTLRNNGEWLVTGNTTIRTANIDLDGNGPETGEITINSGKTLGLIVNQLETDADNSFDGNINVNGGKLSVNTQAPWSLDGELLFNGGGEFESSEDVSIGGIIRGPGTLSGTGEFTVADGGALAPRLLNGASGVMTIDTNLNLLNGSTLGITLDNSGGSVFDKLVVTGDVSLGGRLEVYFFSTFSPALGDSLIIVDIGGTATDTFDSVLSGGEFYLGFEIDYQAGDGNDVALIWTSNLEGDYNNDGSVDAADYTVWRDNLGASASTLLNDKVGGAIGQAQYNSWRDNYGRTLNAISNSNTVPEPAGLAMMLLSFAATSSMLGRRLTSPI